MKQLQLDENVIWKQRYKTRRFSGLQFAGPAKTRGAVLSNESGENWILLWDMDSGQTYPLMKQPPSMCFYA